MESIFKNAIRKSQYHQNFGLIFSKHKKLNRDLRNIIIVMRRALLLYEIYNNYSTKIIESFKKRLKKLDFEITEFDSNEFTEQTFFGNFEILLLGSPCGFGKISYLLKKKIAELIPKFLRVAKIITFNTCPFDVYDIKKCSDCETLLEIEGISSVTSYR